MAYEVFVSHTQRDKEFCDAFDVICARVGIRAFRSEFETIEIPAWRTIKDAVDKSSAVFLLVGRQLVTAQAYPYDANWKYTQNWIAYEVGLACQRGIDVWVLCEEGVEINFPVPYFNNYVPSSRLSSGDIDYMKWVLQKYSAGARFRFPLKGLDVSCPYDNCGIEFNLHALLQPAATIKCAQCLNDIHFPLGFLVEEEIV